MLTKGRGRIFQAKHAQAVGRKELLGLLTEVSDEASGGEKGQTRLGFEDQVIELGLYSKSRGSH